MGGTGYCRRGIKSSGSGEEATTMYYTIVALKEKIMEMYPEIEQQHVSVGLTFDPEKNAYVLNLQGQGYVDNVSGKEGC